MSDLQIAGLLVAVFNVAITFALPAWFQRNEKRIERELGL